MKIKKFKIGNFKSFKDSNNLYDNASAINLIFGPNNSGKSNILKFLELVFRNKYENQGVIVEGIQNNRLVQGPFYEGVITNEPYIYHKNKRAEDITFEFSISITKLELTLSDYEFYALLEAAYFNNANTEIEISFSGKIYSLDKGSTSYIELLNAAIDGQQIYLNNGVTKDYFNGIATLTTNRAAFEKLMSYLNGCILYIDNNRYFQNEKYEGSLKELQPQNFKNWLYNFSLDTYTFNEFENLLKFIRGCKIGKLADIEKLDLTFAIDADNNLEIMLNKGDERLPITSFGTGISQILYILAKIFITESKIIIIEELELNLSPNTQKELFKIFRRLIADHTIDQIFFTSHSPFFNFVTDFSRYEISINTDKVSSITRIVTNTSTSTDKFWRNKITQ